MRSLGFFQLEKNKQLHSFGNPFPLYNPHPQAMNDYPISMYHPDVLREEREEKRCNKMPITLANREYFYLKEDCVSNVYL